MVNATLFKNFPVPWKRICRFGFALLLFMAPAIVCATPVSEALITVTILKHDNLTEICRRYLEQLDNWREIARINRLETPYLIYPGETLQSPAVKLKGIPMNGVVTFVKGSVMSMPPQGTDWVNLQMGDSVSQGSQVKTDLESAVEITFKDGASFYLRSGTTISIQTALENTPHYIFRKLIMPAGKTLMHIKKSTGQDSRFEIQTPSAVSAVRGTHSRVSVDREAITRTRERKRGPWHCKKTWGKYLF